MDSSFSADGHDLRGEAQQEDLQQIVAIDGIEQGGSPSLNTPLRRHPQHGDVDYVTFGRLLMQATPVQQGQHMAQVIAD